MDIVNCTVHDFFKDAVDKLGKNIITNAHFLDVLSDFYLAFDKAKPLKLVLMLLQSDGYCDKLLVLDSSNEIERADALKKYSDEISESYELPHDLVDYGLRCMAFGLRWIDEINDDISKPE